MAGAGYHSRARNLHAAARSMNGHFPQTYEGVRALKGWATIRPPPFVPLPTTCLMPWWTAMLSGAFPIPGIDVPIDSTQGKKVFAALAQEMLDKRHPGRRIIRPLWISAPSSVRPRRQPACFVLWPTAAGRCLGRVSSIAGEAA